MNEHIGDVKSLSDAHTSCVSRNEVTCGLF